MWITFQPDSGSPGFLIDLSQPYLEVAGIDPSACKALCHWVSGYQLPPRLSLTWLISSYAVKSREQVHCCQTLPEQMPPAIVGFAFCFISLLNDTWIDHFLLLILHFHFTILNCRITWTLQPITIWQHLENDMLECAFPPPPSFWCISSLSSLSCLLLEHWKVWFVLLCIIQLLPSPCCSRSYFEASFAKHNKEHR